MQTQEQLKRNYILATEKYYAGLLQRELTNDDIAVITSMVIVAIDIINDPRNDEEKIFEGNLKEFAQELSSPEAL